MLIEQKIFDSFITLLLNNENTPIQFCYFFLQFIFNRISIITLTLQSNADIYEL